MKCRIINWLYTLVPIPSIRRRLLLHLESCPVCRENLADDESIRMDLSKLNFPEKDFWPELEKRLQSHGENISIQKQSRGFSFLWLVPPAIGAVLLAGLIFIPFQSIRIQTLPAAEKSNPQATFTMISAQIEGKEAQAYIIQPENPNMVIVWFEKT